MTDALPHGWIKTTLGEITRPTRARAIPRDTPSTRYVGLEHIEPQTMKLLGHGYARDVRSSSVRFAEGDVLYGRMRPYLNKVWIAEFDGLCSAEFLVFPKRDGLNTNFLAIRLNAGDFVSFANGQVSGERPRVDFDRLSPFSIMLPPLSEQERIFAKVRATFSAIARAEGAARRAQQRLLRYRGAVLEAAITGELTRDWRATQLINKSVSETAGSLLRRIGAKRRAEWEYAELQRFRSLGREPRDEKWKAKYPEPTPPNLASLPRLPEGWVWASLDQLGELHRGRSTHRPRDDRRLYGGPYPFIQTGDIRKSGGTIQNHTQTYSEFGLSQSRLWPTGTLCITIAANIAETGILTYPACFPDSVVGFLQDESLLKVRFVEFFIRSEKSELERYAPATAQKNINMKILEGLAVPLPPLDEQSEIVHEAERRLSSASRLEATLDQQLGRALSTRQSVLEEAFAGRLVLQDPNDPPAVTLLERVRIARESETDKSKGKRMPKSKIPRQNVSGPRNLLAVLKDNEGPMTPEELFHESGHSQESVDQFFAELRELTGSPNKVIESRDAAGVISLKAAS